MTLTNYYEGRNLDYEIIFGYNLKNHKIIKDDDCNGLYWYNDDLIQVNLVSDEYSSKSDDEIIKSFTQVDTHERLHREIHLATGKTWEKNPTEETIVLIMTGQLNKGKNMLSRLKQWEEKKKRK
jgi:hypothetical protein